MENPVWVPRKTLNSSTYRIQSRTNLYIIITIIVVIIAIIISDAEPCAGQQRRARGQQGVEFDCPEEFGYYPHPSDCTQYYVCVFGGALLESCTGGLMYR
jgi:hypothetical protein